MKSLVTAVLASLITVSLPAANITWTTATVSGPADVSTAGALVGALEVGGTMARTINGVTFAADSSSLSLITLGMGVSVTIPPAEFGPFNLWTGGDPGGDFAYGVTLDTLRWNDAVTAEDFTFSGLTPGRTYEVQMWIVDTRPGTNARVRTVKGNEAVGTPTTSGGPNIARGTFVANASTQVITITGVAGQYGSQLSLLQLRELQRAPIVVTSSADSGTGSLRAALALALAAPGPDTITFQNTSGVLTINLLSTLTVTDTGGVTIDSTARLDPTVLQRGGSSSFRLMSVESGARLTLRGLELRNGGGSGFMDPGSSIDNAGLLYLERCTISGSVCASTTVCGAVRNNNWMSLKHCTLHGNSSTASTGLGGAIFNNGTASLAHCTLWGNNAGTGGGIYNTSTNGYLTLNSCIVGGNTATSGADVSNHGVLERVGSNLIVAGVNAGGGSSFGPTALTSNPLLAAPGLYSGLLGGPITVVPMLNHSPGRDAATVIAGLAVDPRKSARGSTAWTNDFSLFGLGLERAVAYGSGAHENGAFTLTTNTASQQGSLALPDLGSLASFAASFDSLFNQAPAGAAMSFSFGPAPTGPVGGNGVPGAHVVRFDLHNGGLTFGRISYIKPGTGEVAFNEVVLNRVSDLNVTRPVRITLAADGRLTVSYNGTTVINGFPTGYTYAAGDVITFGAQTSTSASFQRVDNIGVLTQPAGPTDLGAVEATSIVNPVVAGWGDSDALFPPPSGLSLREALAVAASGSTVTLSPTVDGRVLQLGSELVIRRAVTVDGTGLTRGFTLNGGNAWRHVKVEAGATAELRGLNLRDGRAGGNGGGSIENLGTLTLTRCTLFNNTAENATGGGGAIYNDGPQLTLNQCTLSGNQSIGLGATEAHGGAICNQTGRTLRLFRCTVTANGCQTTAAAFGGGIENNGLLFLGNTIIAGNTLQGSSGSQGLNIYNYGSVGSIVLYGNNISETGSGGGLVHAAGGSINSSGTGAFVTGTLPMFAPLRNQGGPTLTHTLLPFHTARNAGFLSTDFLSGITTDQRGQPFTGAPDLGASEHELTTLVTSTEAVGPGTFTEAVWAASIISGPDSVTFAPALNNALINLSGPTTSTPEASAVTINDAHPLIIDASALSQGVRLSSLVPCRGFYITAGSIVTMRRLTLTGFQGNGTNYGGAIYCDGNLTLQECTFSGNSTTGGGYGGAIFNNTNPLSLMRCTLSGNRAAAGGAVCSIGSLGLTQCTLTGNTADGSPALGGAVFYSGSLGVSLTRCTITANTAAWRGGGVYHASSQSLTIENSLIAGNTLGSGEGPDIFRTPTSPVNAFGVNLLSSVDSSGFTAGPAVIVAAPQLHPLGSNGGPTQTRPPMAGSPAIDAAPGTMPLPTDQRDLPYIGISDIGACEASLADTFTLTSTADAGPGSLRKILSTAASVPGTDTLTFAPGFTGPVTLSSEIILDSSVTLDGGSSGLTIDGIAASGANRLFTVNSGQTVTLRNLTLTGGTTPAASNGGAVLNNGTLIVEFCTLNANTSTFGGAAIFNAGTLAASKSTLSNNTAGGSGGAIQNAIGATATLTQCTLAGNSCAGGGNAGGAIRNNGALTLTHCTLSGNSLPTTFGGGIYNEPGRTITISHSILHGNTGGDISNFGTVTVTAASIIGTLGGSGTSSGSISTANPLLAPLSNYGGPTQTRALLPGSPARNAATGSGVSSDQRGFSIVGVPDLGAYEAGNHSQNFTAYIWELLPSTATTPQRAATFDFDGDGQTNEAEWLALTDPNSTASAFRVTESAISGSTFNVSIPTVPGRTYQLQSSPGLTGPWLDIGLPVSGSGGSLTLPVDVTGLTSHFFRVIVGGPSS